MSNYNQQFKIQAKERGTAFTKLLKGIKLDQVFSISYKTIRFQLPESSLRYSFARCKVTLHEHLDQTYSVTFGPALIARYDSQGNELRKSTKTPKEVLAA